MTGMWRRLGGTGILVWVVLALTASVCGLRADEPKSAPPVTRVDAREADRLVREKQPVVLDIRTPKEFRAGHLSKAKNLDFNATDFEAKVGGLDREVTYLVYCRSGRRSTQSLETFRKLGFKSIVHLDGGYLDWEKAGLPVEK